MMTTTGTRPMRCLTCNTELEIPVFCRECRRLYPRPESMDYFTLLRLERGYDLDERVVQDKVVALARSIHPDFFTTESQEMRQIAVRLSAEVNEAARVLLDPVLRAGYLLELAGGAPETDRQAVCPEVLGEVMRLREAVEEAKESADGASSARLREEVQARRDEILAGIATLARKLPGATGEEKSRLRTLLNSISYYDNLLESLAVP